MDVHHFEQKLRDKEKELAASLARREGEVRESGGGDVGDNSDRATASEETSKTLQEVTYVSETLDQVRDALIRIQKGTYGRCVVCDREIPAARLEAIPWTPYCIEHQPERPA